MSNNTNPSLLWEGYAMSEKALRDWFAGQALALAAASRGTFDPIDEIASKAYAIADAMLAERAKGHRP